MSEYQHASDVDPENPLVGSGRDGRDRSACCGLNRFRKRSAVIGVLMVIAAAIALVGWAAWRSTQHDHHDDGRPAYSLAQMFDPSLSPSSASLAWIHGAAAVSGADQYISVKGGSFYLTTLPNLDSPQLLIDAADLAPYASLTPPVAPTMMQAEELQVPDVASLHAADQQLPKSVPPSSPRMLRRKAPHQLYSMPHLAQLEQQTFTSLHQQGPAASLESSPLQAANATFTYKSFDLSPDQTRMLFGVNCTQLYRHSSFCTYLVYDIKAKSMTPLADSKPLRIAQWSPTSGHVAYVQDDNIWLLDLSGPVPAAPVQVTNDGAWNVVCNGVMDWVYEEEVYEATSALWWSPDGGSIAFLRFNQTAVPTYGFSFYTAPYNQEFSYKYPKPGAPNSLVTVHTYNLSSGVLHSYPQLRESLFPEYEYIMNVQWFDHHTLLARLETRAQNEWRLYRLSADVDISVSQLSTATAQWYFEPQSMLTSLAPLPYYIDLVNSDSAAGVGRGDHLHLAVYSIEDGKFVKFLTAGDFDVLSLDAVRTVGDDVAVFYTREVKQTDARLAAPTLWRTWLAIGANSTDSVQLLPTSGLTWQSASYSPNAAYVLVQESAVAPCSTLYAVDDSQNLVAPTVLADNGPLVQKLQSSYRMPQTHYLELDSTLPGLKLSASLMAGGDFDPSSCGSKQRPVLVYAYSGPGSQQVTTAYGVTYASQAAFHAALVSSTDYVLLTVDSVGTAGKGEKYRKGYTYKRIGLQERDDLIAAAKWASAQCWSDSDRVSHWGWSYGGFMSSFIAAAGSGIYNRLISVAPVTDWRLYDSVYTERYMLTPAENLDGYTKTSVIQAASTKFDADAWHLFGGTADDNVHFQHSALLVDQLINLDMPVETFYFPNRAHSLTQWKTGQPPRYLYQRLMKLLTGSGGPDGNGQYKPTH